MKTTYVRLSVATVLLILGAGCVSTGPATHALNDRERVAKWEERRAALSTISSWSLRGKMGVRTGRKGGSATLKWDYGETEERIELYGPFGGGRVIINVDADGAVLRDTKGKRVVGESASDVLYQRLGWNVPFDHLSSWARGLPGEGATEIMIDGQGRLKSLVQDNWQVEYQRYETVSGTAIEELALPTKINVAALPGTMEVYADDGEYLGDELSVKVILKRWWEIESDQPTAKN